MPLTSIDSPSVTTSTALPLTMYFIQPRGRNDCSAPKRNSSGTVPSENTSITSAPRTALPLLMA